MDGPRGLPSGRLGDSATGAGGFDTHYPEYFPARRGFADATRRLQVRTTALTGIIHLRPHQNACYHVLRDIMPAETPCRVGLPCRVKPPCVTLQARGVRVAPYINGRIFDQATQTWARDAAVRFAAKDADPIVGTPQLKTCGRCGAQ
jgi:hypothetical protein